MSEVRLCHVPAIRLQADQPNGGIWRFRTVNIAAITVTVGSRYAMEGQMNCTHDNKVMQGPDGPICADCWFEPVGAFIEEHPIGGVEG